MDTSMELIRGAERAALLFHPLRLKILECLREPSSASALARRLGLPRQKVNYHLRELESAALVEPVEERRKGNCVERVVRASARSYFITPEALGAVGLPAEDIRDRFSSAFLISLAARVIREVASLQAGARKEGKRLATFGLETRVRFRSPEARQAFSEELANAVADIVSKYHDETATDGRVFEVALAAYPQVASKRDVHRT